MQTKKAYYYISDMYFFCCCVFQIIPRIMPAIMGGDARIQEKFQDAEYITQVEQMFREKFLENLGVSVYLFFHKYVPQQSKYSIPYIKIILQSMVYSMLV